MRFLTTSIRSFFRLGLAATLLFASTGGSYAASSTTTAPMMFPFTVGLGIAFLSI